MNTLVCMAFLVATAGQRPDPESQRYARPQLIIDAEELGRRKAGDGSVILDVRKLNEYKRGHILNASWVDAGDWAKAFASHREESAWAPRLGKLGIDTENTVFVYGDPATPDAARIWWILRYWGVRDARILNGGWPAWVKAGQGLTTEVKKPTAKEPKLVPEPDRLAVKEQMLKWVGGRAVQILDTRSRAEYCGTKEMAKRSGAIPGATHLEWVEVLDPQTHKFKGPNELLKLFQEKGIDLNRPSVAHCQSGGRASVMAFALELMGAKDVRNYYRSWEEWGNAQDTPIEKVKDE
jgi:thiosulfate/3-mercaptopyruvate sulfurtransferase